MDERRDIDLGKGFVATAGPRLALYHFVRLVQKELDWDRFDTEDGETQMLQAVLTAYRGYEMAGGVVTFPQEEEETKRPFCRVCGLPMPHNVEDQRIHDMDMAKNAAARDGRRKQL